MVQVNKTAQDNLQRIKENVSDAYKYFEDNYKRYHEFRNYIFNKSIDERKRAALNQLQRPALEFNILEA